MHHGHRCSLEVGWREAGRKRAVAQLAESEEQLHASVLQQLAGNAVDAAVLRAVAELAAAIDQVFEEAGVLDAQRGGGGD